MNPFMLPEKDRMLSWRDLRTQISQAATLDEKLEHLLVWWSKAPICRYSIDAFDCSNWPTPWELLNENMFCTSSVSYMMAKTLILAGVEPHRMRLVFIRGNDDERLVLVLDGDIVLNFSYAETFSWNTIRSEFQVLHEFLIDADSVYASGS